MQMTTGAVAEVNRVRRTTYSAATMTLPAANIQVGSSYLRIRIDRVGGDVARGLDGFGTGPGYSANILRAAARLPAPGRPPADPMQVLREEIGRP